MGDRCGERQGKAGTGTAYSVISVMSYSVAAQVFTLLTEDPCPWPLGKCHLTPKCKDGEARNTLMSLMEADRGRILMYDMPLVVSEPASGVARGGGTGSKPPPKCPGAHRALPRR